MSTPLNATDTPTASVKFYKDGSATLALPGSEGKSVRGVDAEHTQGMVADRLIDHAATHGPFRATSIEPNGEVWDMLVDATADPDRRIVVTSKTPPKPGARLALAAEDRKSVV